MKRDPLGVTHRDYNKGALHPLAHPGRLQDALGELNDAAVAGAWLTEVGERLDGPAAFAAGQMAQQLVVDARTHDKRWRTAHRSMTKHTAWFS